VTTALVDIRAELVEVRARLDALLAQLPALVVLEPAPPAPAWMRVGKFAAARGYSSGTISRWCAAGLPHAGRGAGRRIDVVKADEWIRGGGPARAAEASRVAGRKAAHAASEAA
jgi:hypothetical protein